MVSQTVAPIGFVVVACFVAPAEAAVSGVLEGTVRTPDGRAVESMIWMRRADAPGARAEMRARARDDGAFRIERLRAGTYDVFAAGAFGFALARSVALDVPLHLTLAAGAITRLRVFDEEGGSLARHPIRIDVTLVDVGVAYRVRTTASADGTFEMAFPLGADVEIQVHGAGDARGYVRALIERAGMDVEIITTRPGTDGAREEVVNPPAARSSKGSDTFDRP